MPEIFTTATDISPKTQSDPPPSTQPPRKKHHPLSAFMVRPDGVRFETQEESEKVILFMRAHPITNAGWLIAVFILFIAPSLLVPLIFNTHILPSDMPPGYFVVLPFLWYLAIFGYAFTNFLHWYFNIYIVTDKRVVDIDWVNLLYKQLSSTQLEKIQDVTYKQGGIIDSFFDFGNVYIQTAGTQPEFDFEAVPKPEEVVRQIDQLLEKLKEKGSP